MPQKLVSTVCSRTTLANFSAPSPMMSLNPTLHKTRVEHQTSGGADGKERVRGNVLEHLQGGVGPEGV